MSDVLTHEELTSQLLSRPEWHIGTMEDIPCLCRTWTLANFADAFALAGKIAELAENYDHHPQINVAWGLLTVIWWSHDAGGVTQRDVDMAALCDHLSN